MNTPNFSEITRRLLTEWPFTEQQLAAHIGVSQPQVHRLKTGVTKQTSFSTGSRLLDLQRELDARNQVAL